MPRQTQLDEVTLRAGGSVSVKLIKAITEGGEVLMTEPHRHQIDSSTSARKAIEELNKGLEDIGWPHLSEEQSAAITKAMKGKLACR